MNRNLQNPAKLTEFAREFDEEPETIFSKIVNRFTSAYNQNYNNINVIVPSIGHTSTINSTIISPGDTNHTSGDPKLILPGDDESHHSNSISSGSLNNLIRSESSESRLDQRSRNTTSADRTGSESSSIHQQQDVRMADNVEDRTPTSVLQRISNLVAMRSTNHTSYKDTELQKFWMPDSKSKECYECSVKFSTFRRKHHCRLCGQIFCAKCCNQVVPGKIIKCADHLKVCTYCSKIVLSYLKSSDLNTDLKSDLQALKEDLSNKLSISSDSLASIQDRTMAYSSTESKFSQGYREERLTSITNINLSNADRKNILQESNSLKLLHDDMLKMLPSQNRGIDLINFLITNQKSSNKIQAIAILNAMIDAGFLIVLIQSPAVDQTLSTSGSGAGQLGQDFDENLVYKILRKDSVLAAGSSGAMGRSNSFQLDLNVETNSAQLSRQNYDVSLPKNLKSFTMDEELETSLKDDHLLNNLLSTAGSKPLLEGFCDHEELLLDQLLAGASLDRNWSQILIQNCARVAHTLRPELCSTELMDIRHFVNFKKVPGGSRSETKIVGGVVFSKNVVHKEMSTRILNPRILLLQCAIVYQRVEGKFVRLETLLLQENEYLRNVTARILALKPNVVLVHKNVSGIAQDMLRKHGITLVLDVKQSVLQRLALNLQCDIVESIDSNIGQPKLGVCDLFYTKTFHDGGGIAKSLMFFETRSNPRGCCVLLRGGEINELARVKKVASFLLYARYNWRLELAFLLDEFARPPSPKRNIFDSKEQSPLDELMTSNVMPSECKPECNPKTIILPVTKKAEEKVIATENVQDFSDPLRAEGDGKLLAGLISPAVEFAVETPYDNRFRTALSSTILSISPNLTFPLPFLETEQGKKCKLRTHFPKELFYSKHWSEGNERAPHTDDDNNNLSKKDTCLLPIHDFVTTKIVAPIDNRELQTLYANYKASGGRLPKRIKMKILPKGGNGCSLNAANAAARENRDESIESIVYKDALDLYNHQRLPVLFCSYYYSTKTASSFCAQPSLFDMHFYGQNDIMLGSFLERYCFRTSYICPSCNLPMLDHIRRYVHSNGCVMVSLLEDPKKSDEKEIHMHSFCTICHHQPTKSVPMSKDTWCYSFAKYLELRFHGHAYKYRSIENNETEVCQHSLHKDYTQYFSYNGIVTSFEYTQIDTWEISLPSLVVLLKPPPIFDQTSVQEEVNHFSVKGYEVYAKIADKLANFSTDDEVPIMQTLKNILNRDLLIYRGKVERAKSAAIEPSSTYFDVSDAIILMKKSVAESIEAWGPRLNEASFQTATSLISSGNGQSIKKVETPHQIDAGQICTEDLGTVEYASSTVPVPNEIRSEETVSKFADKSDDTIESGIVEPTQKDDVMNVTTSNTATAEKTKENLDKKSIINQLIQILPPSNNHNNSFSSPLPTNEYYNLREGVFPVVVRDQDLSTIIAYSLITNEYLKALDAINNSGNVSDATNSSPHMKRKSQDIGSSSTATPDDEGATADAKENREHKRSRSHHIVINFSDSSTNTQFSCKVYFVREFENMRTNFLKESAHNTNRARRGAGDPDAEPATFDRKSSNISIGSSNRASNAEKINADAEDIRKAFVRSLTRSHRWEAKGGKSGSNFSKTSDDRFILKEMSKQDVSIFENFAPNYFEYVNQCLMSNQPTLLAKILGVFRVTIKKKDSPQEKSVLVMENLFCDREISNKFDLKGSERNRLVDPNHQNHNGEMVLLDENLIQMSWSKPLYILGHSRTILRKAINRDSSFLEKNGVMDYSLLVGLDTHENSLVLGIIDYIRTFTLDKRIESLVKQTGLLGGQGKLPTIVSPKLYKQRFIEAMDRYFLVVPDRWEGLSKH